MTNIKTILNDCNNQIEHIRECINLGRCNTCQFQNPICKEIKPLVGSLVALCNATKESNPIEATQLREVANRIEPQRPLNPFDFGKIMAIVNILNAKLQNSNRKKIFISHTSKDKKLVDSFVENILRLGCGFSISDIVFTSIESTGIKTGADMRNYLKQTLESCDYVFFMISENYKASGICLNEMGAAWALNKKVKPFLLPNLDYKDLEWLYEISKTSRINDVAALGTLHDEMLEAYGLTIHNTADWDKQKQKFIDSIKE